MKPQAIFASSELQAVGYEEFQIWTMHKFQELMLSTWVHSLLVLTRSWKRTSRTVFRLPHKQPPSFTAHSFWFSDYPLLINSVCFSLTLFVSVISLPFPPRTFQMDYIVVKHLTHGQSTDVPCKQTKSRYLEDIAAVRHYNWEAIPSDTHFSFQPKPASSCNTNGLKSLSKS